MCEFDVTASTAERLVQAGIAKAEELGVAINIAVVDRGANLNAFVRMNDAWLGSIDIAIKKARTARFFDRPSADIGKLSQPGGPIYGVEHSNDGLITFAGGMPIKNRNDEVIGAVAVSGSTLENDQAIVEAALAAL